MKKPKNCSECPIYYDGCWCSVTGTPHDYDEEKHKEVVPQDCPIKGEIPDDKLDNIWHGVRYS